MSFTVALIGADGAGKTSIGHRLESGYHRPVRYMYMGVNTGAGTHMLPTTRALRSLKRLRGQAEYHGPPPEMAAPAAVRAPRRPPLRRVLAAARAAARTTNLLAEEWYRQGVAALHRRRGRIVVFDRHFLADYHAHDMTAGRGQPWGRRLHGAVLRRLYPRPDLVLFLDASPQVLLARKGEGDLQSLARRRSDYLATAAEWPRFRRIDADGSIEDVFSAVCRELDTLTGEVA